MKMRIPEEFVLRLKSNISIVSLFEKYVTLKRTGRDYVCLCPFHSEKTPSCHIYTDEDSFYCFGCGAGGDIINFMRLTENMEYPEAVKELAGYAGLTVPETDGTSYPDVNRKARILEMNRTAAKFWAEQLLLNEFPQTYLRNRGLTPGTIRRFGIGWAENSWDTLRKYMKGKGYADEEMHEGSLLVRNDKTGSFYDKFRGRIMFPIIDKRRNVIGFGGRATTPEEEPKYLNSSETAAFQKRNNLFALNFAKDAKKGKLILCEGYMDAIALHQAGFDNAVATLGTAITDAQARLMKQFADEVTVSYDADEAGQKACLKAVNVLSKAGVNTKVLHMTGAKDPDEYIKNFGKEHFAELLNNASPALSFTLGGLKNNADLSTPEGRAEYFKKASDIIAGIENKLDRTIHTADLARECQIPPAAAEKTIDDKIKYNRNKLNKIYQNEIVFGSTKRNDVTPEEKEYPREIRAEKIVLAHLMHDPDTADLILSSLTDTDFTAEFHRKLFLSVVFQINERDFADISTLGAEFSPQEMGRIEKIKRDASELPFTKENLTDNINIMLKLKKERQESKNAAESNESLLEFQRELQRKNTEALSADLVRAI
jgi:DNA primase